MSRFLSFFVGCAPAALSLSLSGCGSIENPIDPLLPPPPEELDLWADAAAGITRPELARLANEVWQADLEHDPFQATYLGDPRYHGEVPDLSREARLAWQARQREFLRRLRLIEPGLASEEDRLTAELLREKLEDAVAHVDLGLEEWVVDPIEGPHVVILNVASVQPHGNEREREQLVERWRGFGSYLRQAARNLEYGKRDGKVSSETAIRKCIAQLESLLAIPPFESPLVQVATGGGRCVDLAPGGNVAALAHEHLSDARRQDVLFQLNPHLVDMQRKELGTKVLLPPPGDPLTPAERGAHFHAVLEAVEREVYPALAGYHDVLSERILPVARSDEKPGLCHLPGGLANYRRLIHEHTSLPFEECDPEALHAFGLEEVERIRGEIGAMGQKLFGTARVAEIQERLRSDPAMHFTSREEVAAKAREALARARLRMRDHFGILPESPCEVLPVPSHEERDTTIAYYRAPAADGSRPGRYFVNTFEPETRPRYEAEVLAFHEAIPGHHLQIAIAQELEDLPRFRRHGGTTAFAEGWALYTERLADEMGLYSGDLDRMGVLSYDAWRACRLVVDTGIHAFGWDRERAIEYLLDNTLLARNNVENEVDRYIAWPAQALAYKIGQREILALREAARAALGARYSDTEFHDRVLENGAVTLSSLRGIIGRWLGTPIPVPTVEAAAPSSKG
jgi:uncharacterized protein (DUF885 family)